MFKRSVQVSIVVTHLILLAWIVYILAYGGALSMNALILHFTGIGLLGVFSIIGTAKIEMFFFRKSVRKKK